MATPSVPTVPTLIEVQTLAGKYGGNLRHHPEEDHEDLAREVKAATLARYLDEILDKAPPLDRKQRAELVRIFRHAASRPGPTQPPAPSRPDVRLASRMPSDFVESSQPFGGDAA